MISLTAVASLILELGFHLSYNKHRPYIRLRTPSFIHLLCRQNLYVDCEKATTIDLLCVPVGTRMSVQGCRYKDVGTEMAVQGCRYKDVGTMMSVQGCRYRGVEIVLGTCRRHEYLTQSDQLQDN